VILVHYLATGFGGFNWVGLANFDRLWADEEISASIGNTIFLAISSMLVVNFMGLILALALNRGLKTRYVLRTLLFLPVVLSTVAVSFLFRYIFDYGGPVNQFLSLLGYQGDPILWTADTTWSIWLILFVVCWQTIGFAMVIFLGGLATVPPELEEAAAIDGAGLFRRFFSVTVPMIQPSLAVATTLGMVQGLKIFDQVMSLTNGGPDGATQTLSLVIYNTTFANSQFGYGSAVALVFTVFILIAGGLQMFLTRDRSGMNK
jgi:raffinose/stachyose/melibiose transport system permease protein